MILRSRSVCLALVLLVAVAGCKSESSSKKKQFLDMGTAPVGGAFNVVGQSIAEVLNAHTGTIDWKVQAKGTKGSQENIRRLQQGEYTLALSNAAISYFAVRGEGVWTEKYDTRAIATMAPNVAFFIAPRRLGDSVHRGSQRQTSHHRTSRRRFSDVYRTDPFGTRDRLG